MNHLRSTSRDNGAWFADYRMTSVRPATNGDAGNQRFATYQDAVRDLVWNAMLGCKLASGRVETAKARLAEAQKETADMCAELDRAIRLMEETPDA